MKKGILRRISVVIITLCILMPGLFACNNGKVDDARFDVELKSGYGNSIEIGSYAPFYVEITNNGKDFEGSVQMIMPGKGGNILYEKEVALPANGTKTVELVGMVDQITRQVNIRVADKKGNIIWSSLENCITLTDLRNVNVGILSDDYSALGYMDQKTFSAYNELSTKIYELNKDSFPTDWHALDMLDVIVISDFSTDALSEQQLNALNLWVSDGGLLMVGTGSTSNKTLAALNGNIFDVKVGDLEGYNTKFGLSITNYTYDYGYEYSYNSPYNDTLYSSFFEQNYDTIRNTLEAEYMDQFKADYYYDDSYDTWDEYWEDSFYWYCFDMFYTEYLNSTGGGNNINYIKVESMPYVKADVLKFSGDLLSDDTTIVFEGEQENGNNYDLAYAFNQGEGYVLLSAIDFTKTPFSNYEGNYMLFMHWVESFIGQRCYDKAMEYEQYTYSYYNPYDVTYAEEQLYYGSTTATVPPVFVYVLLILAYIVFILVIYLVLRNKKKTTKLWVLYPLVAVGLSLLIFCIGFSTRLYRPVVGAITVVTPNGSTSVQNSYVSVTVPGNKDYQVGFSPSQSVEYENYEYSGYYYDETEIMWDTYKIGYKFGYDSVDVTLGGQEAMGTVNFALSAVASDQRNIVIQSESSGFNSLSITNHYGCDLEDAAIIVDGEVYVIGSMENGETVQARHLVKERQLKLGRDGLGVIMLQDESGKSLWGVMFGSVSNIYDDYLCKSRALNSFTEYVDRGNTPDVMFVGIPSEHTAMELQGATNYTERRVEIIYVEYNYPGWGY